jgi:hypothetical protein
MCSWFTDGLTNAFDKKGDEIGFGAIAGIGSEYGGEGSAERLL